MEGVGVNEVALGRPGICSHGEPERDEPRRGWNSLRGKPQLSALLLEAGMDVHGTTLIYFLSCFFT